MGVKITASYLGNKKVKLIHGPSGSEIITDAPKDNNGEGKFFSPTDLLAASYGTCMMTVMAIMAERSGIKLEKMNIEIEKNMSEDSPRRIKTIPVVFHLSANFTEVERRKLEAAAKTCPVAHSLNPEIEHDITFHYDLR
jgi:putative redox protein